MLKKPQKCPIYSKIQYSLFKIYRLIFEAGDTQINKNEGF
jgi:hypothetical protein